MKELPIAIYTDHSINKTLCYSFASGSKSLMCHVNNFKEYNKTIITYGVLRGTGELIKKVKNYYYMDHGYFNQSNRVFENKKTSVIDLDGYFRIVFNNLIFNNKGNHSSDRLKKLNLKFYDKKKLGQHIILSEPSEAMKKFYNVNNWTEETIKLINQFSDRKIIIHNKFSKASLDDLLLDAWAFVSLQSTAGFKAMLKGVPAYFTDKTLSTISKIEEIEEHKINYSIFNNLAYSQWTINEIKSGEAWEFISKQNNR